MTPDMELIAIEAARLCSPRSDWSGRFGDYDTMLLAGVPADEAERIATATYRATVIKLERKQQ